MSATSNAYPELDRDLSFHPLENPHLQKLSQQQIDQYNKKGFIFPLDVFSDDEVLFFSLTKSGDFEEKILWALSNYETMLVKADNAYKKLNKEFLWKNIALEYETQYKYLL